MVRHPQRGLGTFVLALLAWVALGLPAAALEAGAVAPEIERTDFRGRQIKLADLRGKVVVVDFWASWCAPCKDELPVLEELHKKYASRGLVVIGINIDEKKKNADGFLQTMPLSFTLVHDADHALAKKYQPGTMPSSYVIDREGRVRFVHTGFRKKDADALEKEIQKLLK